MYIKYDFAYTLIGRIVVKFPKDILSRFICAVFRLRREGGSATETEYSEIPADPDKRQESLSVASETFSSSHCVPASPPRPARSFPPFLLFLPHCTQSVVQLRPRTASIFSPPTFASLPPFQSEARPAIVLCYTVLLAHSPAGRGRVAMAAPGERADSLSRFRLG